MKPVGPPCEAEMANQLVCCSMWIYGDYCKPLSANGVDATTLYPDVPVTDIEAFLKTFVASS